MTEPPAAPPAPELPPERINIPGFFVGKFSELEKGVQRVWKAAVNFAWKHFGSQP